MMAFRWQYEVGSHKEKLKETGRFVEEFTFLQTVGELIIIFEAFFRALTGNWVDFCLFGLYLALIKIKQGMSWPFRSSLNRMHMFLKIKLVGKPKLQYCYQMAHEFMNKFDSAGCEMKIELY